MRIALAVLLACGPRESAPVDYGPPAEPVDPIACPQTTLDRYAARLGGTLTISTEPLVDAGRVDKLPCKPSETDDACIARGRARPAPTAYEIVGVKIGGDVTHVDFTYDIDGRRVTEQAVSMDAMVARIKALQGQGHKVTLIRGESAPDAGSRHAAITYRGVGIRQRRVAAVRIRPDGGRIDEDPRTSARIIEDAVALAGEGLLEVRSTGLDAETNEVLLTVTCGNV